MARTQKFACNSLLIRRWSSGHSVYFQLITNIAGENEEMSQRIY